MYKLFPKRECQAHGHVGLRAAWFVWTGEHRPPRKGEWFRSGAIPEAYQAETDGITMLYDIMRPAKVTKRCPRCRHATEIQ